MRRQYDFPGALGYGEGGSNGEKQGGVSPGDLAPLKAAPFRNLFIVPALLSISCFMADRRQGFQSHKRIWRKLSRDMS